MSDINIDLLKLIPTIQSQNITIIYVPTFLLL